MQKAELSRNVRFPRIPFREGKHGLFARAVEGKHPSHNDLTGITRKKAIFCFTFHPLERGTTDHVDKTALREW